LAISIFSNALLTQSNLPVCSLRHLLQYVFAIPFAWMWRFAACPLWRKQEQNTGGDHRYLKHATKLYIRN